MVFSNIAKNISPLRPLKPCLQRSYPPQKPLLQIRAPKTQTNNRHSLPLAILRFRVLLKNFSAFAGCGAGGGVGDVDAFGEVDGGFEDAVFYAGAGGVGLEGESERANKSRGAIKTS